jgi:hypothetical protein
MRQDKKDEQRISGGLTGLSLTFAEFPVSVREMLAYRGEGRPARVPGVMIAPDYAGQVVITMDEWRALAEYALRWLALDAEASLHDDSGTEEP